VTVLHIGVTRPRTVDLAAELIAVSDDLMTLIWTFTRDGQRITIADIADDIAAAAITDRNDTQPSPGEIHRMARRLVDITDTLDDYGPDSVMCGVLGLASARLHRLADAVAVTPIGVA